MSPRSGRHRRESKAPWFETTAPFFCLKAADSAYTGRVIPQSSLLCLLLLCLASCASKDPSTTPIEGTENSPDGPGYLVGIVEFVNPDQRFVLIKTQGAALVPSGASLTALDATGALSEIVVSPERKGAHLTADIKSGNPRAGNLVVYQPEKKGSGSPPTATRGPSSGPDVEWREGQPPPLDPAFAPSADPLSPTPDTIPLAPGESPIPLQPSPIDPISPLPAPPQP